MCYLLFECGYFQGKEGCETRWDENVADWVKKCQKVAKKKYKSWKHMLSNLLVKTFGNNYSNNTELINACCFNKTVAKTYKMVFVADALWDFNFGHFLTDVLGRIIRHLPFLHSHPDIMIHIRNEMPPPRKSYEYFMVRIQLLIDSFSLVCRMLSFVFIF